MATKTSLKRWIQCVLSICIAITPTGLLCQMQANSFWAEFLRTTFKFTSFVCVLHKTWNKAFSRRSRAVTAKKCTKSRAARAEVLLCPRVANFIDEWSHCDFCFTNFGVILEYLESSITTKKAIFRLSNTWSWHVYTIVMDTRSSCGGPLTAVIE